MTYRIQILPTAWEDLKHIEDWYLIRFGVETALKVSGHILDMKCYNKVVTGVANKV